METLPDHVTAAIVSENRHFLPPDLKEEYQDALIIYAEDSPRDREKSGELCDAIREFRFHDGITGKAVLFDDAVTHVTTHVDRLDEAAKYSSLTLVVYSDHLQNDTISIRNSNAMLWNTIEERGQRGTFIPVVWKRETNLPLLVREIRSLDLRKASWKVTLKKLLEGHLGTRLERHRDQEMAQLEFLTKHHPELFRSPDGDSRWRHVIAPSDVQHNHQFVGNVNRQPSVGNFDVQSGRDELNEREEDVNQNGQRSSWNRLVNALIGGRGIYVAGALGLGLLSCVFIVARSSINSRTAAVMSLFRK